MTIDKSTWGPGPWQDEPDYLEWNVEEIRCEIRRHTTLGHLCGYITIPHGHPWEDEDLCEAQVNIHGGVTWHIGRDDGRTQIGFDCGHAWDLSPGFRGRVDDTPPPDYRDLQYVKSEVMSLAGQALIAGAVPKVPEVPAPETPAPETPAPETPLYTAEIWNQYRKGAHWRMYEHGTNSLDYWGHRVARLRSDYPTEKFAVRNIKLQNPVEVR